MSRVVVDWWGRPIVASLPRLFLDHFWSTSTVVDDDGRSVAFLVGFLSPSEPGQAYIHFVGIDQRIVAAGSAASCTSASSPWPASRVPPRCRR